MDLPTLRRKNLRLIVDDRFAGNAAAFGRLIDRSQSQVSDLLAGRKSFGEKTARYIEERLRIEPYTLYQASMAPRDPVMAQMVEDLSRLNTRNRAVLRVMMDGLLAGQCDDDDNGETASKDDGRTDGRTEQ